jgi:hypothetical protein
VNTAPTPYEALAALILKRASVSRPSGQWRDDDYDVLENGVVVGRIFKVPVAPPDRPWMWASGHSAATVKRAAHGYEPTREAALAAYAGGSWAGEGLTGGRYRRRRRR